MPMSIAEMRAAGSKAAALPERYYDLCLAQKLMATVEALNEERTEVLLATVRNRDGNTAAPPPRLADERAAQAAQRVAEIDAELAAAHEEMLEHTGTLTLRGWQSGKWRRWTDANPPREGNVLDNDAAYGYCNSTKLIEAMGEFAAEWNGAPIVEDEWTWIVERAAPGDLKELCRRVVQMHEGNGVKAPKSPTSSSTTTSDEND